jgi:hypothetical protein
LLNPLLFFDRDHGPRLDEYQWNVADFMFGYSIWKSGLAAVYL